tara:strand:+ start:296 stop:820 length:525 start_codon:yes stop_codon:yes gene_type:complete
MIEATVVEYITKRRKHSKTLLVKVLVERKDKSSTLVNVPFSYTNFPALIYYNKTILIGQKVNIEFDLDPVTSEEVDMRLVPWEEQETHIRETIYGLFFEAMSELYFTKEKSDAFRKEFERFRRKRLKERNQLLRSSEAKKTDQSFVEETANKIKRKTLEKNKRMLERIFKFRST